MSKSNRLYFFKVFKNFYRTPEHKYLRRQENGVSYVYLYNIMLDLGLETEGKLQMHVGKEVIPLTDKDIAKEAELSIDTVQMGILHLYKAGLVEQLVDGTFYMTKFENIVGSETDSAQRMRKKRKSFNESARYRIKKDAQQKQNTNRLLPP